MQLMLGYNDISLKETQFYYDAYAEGQLEELAEALLSFSEVSALTAWLREHGV
jgi:hypothetical protein